jgi:hypothetical protein
MWTSHRTLPDGHGPGDALPVIVMVSFAAKTVMERPSGAPRSPCGGRYREQPQFCDPRGPVRSVDGSHAPGARPDPSDFARLSGTGHELWPPSGATPGVAGAEVFRRPGSWGTGASLRSAPTALVPLRGCCRHSNNRINSSALTVGARFPRMNPISYRISQPGRTQDLLQCGTDRGTFPMNGERRSQRPAECLRRLVTEPAKPRPDGPPHVRHSRR